MPVGDLIFLGPCSHSLGLLVPPGADDECLQQEHFFSVGFQPECTVPLRSQIDHLPDSAFNRTTSERQTELAKVILLKSF
jgi:hypothetical protein